MASQDAKAVNVLIRDQLASIRLNAQHHLWQQTYTRYLHPGYLDADDDYKIADIGVGSGIWLMDVARFLPDTMQLVGIDIDFSQCPLPEWLPSNVELYKWNVYEEVPWPLFQSFDGVYVRDFRLGVLENDPGPVLQNLLRLIKPGGHLQWGEWNPANLRFVKANPEASTVAIEKAWSDNLGLRGLKSQPTWPGELDVHFREAGMVDVNKDARYGPTSNVSYESDSHLMMLFDALARYRGKIAKSRTEEAERTLVRAAREVRAGAGWNMECVLVTGQKPREVPGEY